MIQAQKTNMRHLMPLLAAAASVLSTAPASADLGDQLAKLLPKDGAAREFDHAPKSNWTLEPSDLTLRPPWAQMRSWVQTIGAFRTTTP